LFFLACCTAMPSNCFKSTCSVLIHSSEGVSLALYYYPISAAKLYKWFHWVKITRLLFWAALITKCSRKLEKRQCSGPQPDDCCTNAEAALDPCYYADNNLVWPAGLGICAISRHAGAIDLAKCKKNVCKPVQQLNLVCCASDTEAIADALAGDKTHLGLGSLLVDLGLLLSHHGLVLIQGHFLRANKDEHARSNTLQEHFQQDV